MYYIPMSNKLDANAGARGFNSELHQYASRVSAQCGLTVVYKMPPPLNLAGRDIPCSEYNRQWINKNILFKGLLIVLKILKFNYRYLVSTQYVRQGRLDTRYIPLLCTVLWAPCGSSCVLLISSWYLSTFHQLMAIVYLPICTK